MMRFRTPLGVLVFAAVAMLAPRAPVSAAEPITFAIKFPAGEIDRQTNTIELDQTISSNIVPTPKKQSMKMSAQTAFKPIKTDAAGSDVELTYDSMKLSGSMLPQGASDELDKLLAAFAGEKITLHFTPDGKVDKVEGVDAIRAKFPTRVGQTAVAQFFSDDRIKEQYNVVIAQILPTKPVNIGDTWETEISQKLSAVEVKIKSQVKLVGIDERNGHKIAKLEFSGKGKLEAAIAAGAPKMNFDQLDQNGTAEFDLTRGWLTSQIAEQHSKGTIRLNGPGNAPVDLKIDQTVKGTTTLTAAKADATAAEPKKADKPENSK